jgi:Putative zinc-finger
MVPYLGCEQARELLQGFVDGELPVEAQVALESHLRWCRTCGAHVEDLRLIGDSIRLRGARSRDTGPSDRQLAVLQSSVLSRVRVEQENALVAQVGAFFDYRHLWAGLGATMALVACLFGTMGVLHAASVERPDSLAGLIQSFANPGSDRNPMRLDGRMIQVPRALDDSPALDLLGEDEAVFALAAVVTREGRIANYELLLSERDGASHFHRTSQPNHVTTLLNKVTRSRFTPAEQGVARAPVAVNMVWLLARTTVKGSPRPLEFNPPPVAEPEAEAEVLPPPKPAATQGTSNEAQAGSDRFARPATVVV